MVSMITITVFSTCSFLQTAGHRYFLRLRRLLHRLLPPAKPQAALGYIHNIYVRDEGRSAGVGSSLLTAATTALKAQGIRRLRAHVIAGNEASFALFAKAGLLPTQTAVEGEV
jgi:ribosomal protein S18 acetylase RimI-like enzyme